MDGPAGVNSFVCAHSSCMIGFVLLNKVDLIFLTEF